MIRISEANSSEKQDSIKKLLFNDAIITGDDQKLFTSVLLDESKEGWIGIPHGGIAMGALTELAFMLWENSGRKEKYPFRADFRFGGTAARVGDSSYMEVSRQNNLIQGNILINQDQTPYLEAELKPEEDSTRNPESRLSELNITSVDMHPLPFYSNCFVCGSERKEDHRFHQRAAGYFQGLQHQHAPLPFRQGRYRRNRGSVRPQGQGRGAQADHYQESIAGFPGYPL